MSKIPATCRECGKIFYVHPYRIKRGNVKFCSISCNTRHRNKVDNPSKRPEVRAKVSLNHADVSGSKNPMYGRRGVDAPAYIDGRNKVAGDLWRKIALTHKPHKCEICGMEAEGRILHVHHKDKDRSNNDLDNLQVVCVYCHTNILHPRERDTLGRFIKEVV